MQKFGGSDTQQTLLSKEVSFVANPEIPVCKGVFECKGVFVQSLQLNNTKEVPRYESYIIKNL